MSRNMLVGVGTLKILMLIFSVREQVMRVI